MAKTGAVDAPEHPVDLTEELPLDDENVLAAEPRSVWRYVARRTNCAIRRWYFAIPWPYRFWAKLTLNRSMRP